MKVRYIIQHHPGLFTEIMVEDETGKRTQIEDRFDWGTAREYCRAGVRAHGIEPTIEKPDRNTEVFPWVNIT